MPSCDALCGAALPVAAAALLLAAAARGAPADYARVRREGGTFFLRERVMQRGYVWIDALARGAVAAGLTANAITWLSFVLGAAAGICAGLGWLGTAAWALALSGLCDGVDGAVARRTRAASPAGAVLDSALDRYVEFFFIAGLIVWLRGHWAHQLVAVTALFGGFMVTYSTAKAEALQVTPPRGWMKRPERIVWLVAGSACAAAGTLLGVPSLHIISAVLALIAVFAHASAFLRLRALTFATRQRDQISDVRCQTSGIRDRAPTSDV
ncbi:CDP-alcohol phosphatidyltransferase family protein [Opitutus sp. ER46]|uniref:CDP-alcohol phosphatidyltransferase family protein n=1 Tax=Opitutus sp. ER46 TaxID=2161864 RepID=UPI001304E331|nr:CDP-alcohol phosphatidyltransferase family protein [Opitutus sp. ER46]